MPILTPMERLGGTVAGRYEIAALLAEGGMGFVYRAHDRRGRRWVALKVLKHEDPARDASAYQRLEREQEALAQLNHPHIVRCLDIGQTEDGMGFIAMELVEGQTLAELFKDRAPLTREALFGFWFSIAGALAHAHRHGVIHRDVKPSNVLITSDVYGRPYVKLLDFGLAKEVDSARVTQTGRTVGTPHYMAPEQARGELSISPACDVWALGVLCFEALTGRLPFEGGAATQVVFRVATERAPRLAEMPEVCRRGGAQVARVVDRALESDLQHRYRDASAFARAMVEAAIADGAELPDNPDPLGLPDFASWVRAAERAVQPTMSSPSVTAAKPVNTTSPQSAPKAPVLTIEQRPPRAQAGSVSTSVIRTRSFLLWITALTLSLALAFFFLRASRPARPADKVVDVREVVLPKTPGVVPAAPDPKPATSSPPSAAVPLAPAPAEPPPTRPTSETRSIRPPKRTPPTRPSGAPAAQTKGAAPTRSVLELDPTWR